MNLHDAVETAFGADGVVWAYRSLIAIWALCFLLSVRPSAGVYTSKKSDWNDWRPLFQVLAAVFLPWFIFSLLADFDLWSRQAAIYPIIACIVFFFARAFTTVVSDHGPDARAGEDFRFWVRILSEGEIGHLISSARRSKWLMALFTVCTLTIITAYVAISEYALLLSMTDKVQDQPALVAGFLFSGVACIAFLVTSFISISALDMQSVSFPVRYGVAANSLLVFLSATWAAIYPWFIFGTAVNVQYMMVTIVVVAYLALVFWPMISWRSMFRQTRLVRLREFRRIVTRIEVAARPKPDAIEENDYYSFQTTSMRKAYTALTLTLERIVGGSPFRAFTMIHINAPRKENRNKLEGQKDTWPWYIELWRVIIDRQPRPPEPEHRDDVLCAHMKAAVPTLERLKKDKAAKEVIKRHEPEREYDDMDGYQQFVHDWIKRECETVDKRYIDENQRIISALEIANPQLKKMITKYRHGIEQTDYRYRLMYWSARLLSRMRKGGGEEAVANAPYLLPLTHEILADLDHLERRWDSKSLVLSVGGAVATGLFSLMLAVGQGAAQALMTVLVPGAEGN